MHCHLPDRTRTPYSNDIVVLVMAKGTTTLSPIRKFFVCLPISTTSHMQSWPITPPFSMSGMTPLNGRRSEPPMPQLETWMIASVSSLIIGSKTVSYQISFFCISIVLSWCIYQSYLVERTTSVLHVLAIAMTMPRFHVQQLTQLGHRSSKGASVGYCSPGR